MKWRDVDYLSHNLTATVRYPDLRVTPAEVHEITGRIDCDHEGMLPLLVTMTEKHTFHGDSVVILHQPGA